MLAASLRSLRLRGKDSWLMHFLEQTNHREGMSTTVAYASGSERYVFLSWLLLISVKFRVNPWQMLLLILMPLLPLPWLIFAWPSIVPFNV